MIRVKKTLKITHFFSLTLYKNNYLSKTRNWNNLRINSMKGDSNKLYNNSIEFIKVSRKVFNSIFVKI